MSEPAEQPLKDLDEDALREIGFERGVAYARNTRNEFPKRVREAAQGLIEDATDERLTDSRARFKRVAEGVSQSLGAWEAISVVDLFEYRAAIDATVGSRIDNEDLPEEKRASLNEGVDDGIESVFSGVLPSGDIRIEKAAERAFLDGLDELRSAADVCGLDPDGDETWSIIKQAWGADKVTQEYRETVNAMNRMENLARP